MVVIGGGAAGAAAVAELRHHGFDGAITLVCGEDAVPYERPPLSKEFLLDAATSSTTSSCGSARWPQGSTRGRAASPSRTAPASAMTGC
jgi:3-phenylpropionate/trans-cinnamate dioxygenase ferredoxin reductase subunit